MADGAVDERAESTLLPKKGNKTTRFLSKDHKLKKRPPQKPEYAENVIYVSTKSNIKALTERCQKLIGRDEEEIVIYCLGAAVQRGILVALQLCENNLSYKVSTNTLTTDLIDDLEPATDDADYEIQRRQNSALKIRVYRADPLRTAADP